MKDKVFKDKIPFNLELLILNSSMTSSISEVTSKDIFEQNSTVFNVNGLFSNEIFSAVGSTARLSSYGYISINVRVMHPLIYRMVISLKSLYKDILTSKKYVLFDEKTNEFVETTIEKGRTGYSYFLKYFDKLKFTETDSDERKQKIKFIKLYTAQDISIDKYLVIPAGLRDYTVTENGKIMEDEINNLYRRLLSVASTAKQFSNTGNDENFANILMVRAQIIVNEIYDYIENILEGKEGFITGKWVKRRITYGTRNVLTSIPIEVKDYDLPDRPMVNDTVVGIYQYLKSITNIAIHKVRSKFLNDIFTLETASAYLINKKTLNKEIVTLSEKSREHWLTDDGLEKTMNKLIQDTIKSSDIIVDDRYLLLVYDDGTDIFILSDINELPVGKDMKYVRPMKYVELFYLAVQDTSSKYYMLVTRYPITAYGSIYPSKLYLKVDLKGSRRNININGITNITYEYPDFSNIKDKIYFNSMAVENTHISTLNADFDGDKLNVIVLWEEESLQEIKELLNNVDYYVDLSGALYFTNSDDISEIAMAIFTE